MVDHLQWPAMVITVLAAWLVASCSARKRKVGFWVFLASNIVWIVWALHAHAYALIVLQIALAILNFRGVYKNEPPSGQAERGERAARESGTSPLPAS